MKTHTLTQGSPEWHAYRREHFNASDAPVMMGRSPYKTRTELLNELSTGITPEVDAATQSRFDAGHRFEALARPLAEEIIGQELYAVTGSEGELSASFDGLTADDSIAFEHKTINGDLRAAFDDIDTIAPEHRSAAGGRLLPLHYRVQMEQQLMVSGAKAVLFMATKWAGDECTEKRHAWYVSDGVLRREIAAGWAQFSEDLSAHKPTAPAAPAPTGRAPETLPALHIKVTGQVAASNLPEFKATALAAIRSVNRELTTDQHFADAERAVKWCSEVEDRLEAAKQHALSQTASIDELFRTMDDIGAEAKRVRLELTKLVAARKEAVKGEMVQDARMALADYMAGLNERCAPARVPTAAVDFAAAIKGKRSIAAMQDAINTELARAKIDSSEMADKIAANVRTLIAQTEHAGLFPDVAALALKQPEDLVATITARIAEHAAAQERRMEAERARIRAEEQAKAQREAAAEAASVEAKRLADEAEQRRKVLAEEAAASARAIAEMARNTPAQDSQQVLKAEPVTADATAREIPASTSPRVGAMGAGQAADAALLDASLPKTATCTKSQTAEPATLKLGEICTRLGFVVTAAFLADTLHIQHSATDKAAKLYRESDWPRICRQLTAHISAAAELYAPEEQTA